MTFNIKVNVAAVLKILLDTLLFELNSYYIPQNHFFIFYVWYTKSMSFSVLALVNGIVTPIIDKLLVNRCSRGL